MNSYFSDGEMFFPLNFHVMLHGGKLDTTQPKFAMPSLLTSADRTPRIRGASAEEQENNAKP